MATSRTALCVLLVPFAVITGEYTESSGDGPEFQYSMTRTHCHEVAGVPATTLEECIDFAYSMDLINHPWASHITQNNGKNRYKKPYGCYYDASESEQNGPRVHWNQDGRRDFGAKYQGLCRTTIPDHDVIFGASETSSCAMGWSSITSLLECSMAGNTLGDMEESPMAIETAGRRKASKPGGCYFDVVRHALFFNPAGKIDGSNTRANALVARGLVKVLCSKEMMDYPAP